jgi:hypothetical protein
MLIDSMNLVSRTANYSFLPLLVLKHVSQIPFTYLHPSNVSIEDHGSCMMLQGMLPEYGYIRICGYGQIYLFGYNILMCVFVWVSEWVGELSHTQVSSEVHAVAWETVEHEAYNI